jgi:hypothetical protein
VLPDFLFQVIRFVLELGDFVSGFACLIPVFLYDGGKERVQLPRTLKRNIYVFFERHDRRSAEYVCQDVGHCWSPCWIRVRCCSTRGMRIRSGGILPEEVQIGAIFYRFAAC